MLRKWGSAVAAAALFVSTAGAAFGGTNVEQGALAPGKAANVQQAQMMDTDTMWIVGGGVVIVALCFLVCHGGNHTHEQTTPGSATTPATTGP